MSGLGGVHGMRARWEVNFSNPKTGVGESYTVISEVTDNERADKVNAAAKAMPLFAQAHPLSDIEDRKNWEIGPAIKGDLVPYEESEIITGEDFVRSVRSMLRGEPQYEWGIRYDHPEMQDDLVNESDARAVIATGSHGKLMRRQVNEWEEVQ